MGKKKRDGGHGRLMWSPQGGRLTDLDGRVYEQVGDDLTRDDIARWLGTPGVRMAVSLCAGPLRWIGEDQHEQVWAREISPNFHDNRGWKPPPGAPGQLPFHATLWKADRDAAVTLLFTDLD